LGGKSIISLGESPFGTPKKGCNLYSPKKTSLIWGIVFNGGGKGGTLSLKKF